MLLESILLDELIRFMKHELIRFMNFTKIKVQNYIMRMEFQTFY